MRVMIVVLGLLASPAAAADQFDLVCTAEKANERYRIDLLKNEWCAGDCSQIEKIKTTTSGMIVLREHEPAGLDRERSFNTINRVTGAWEWYFYNPRYSITWNHKGTCKPEGFSGFGTSNRKF